MEQPTEIRQSSGFEILKSLFTQAFAQNIPAALWKLPGTKEQNFIADFSYDISPQKIHLETSKPGFAFSPFLNPGNEKTFFIHRDVHYSTRQNLDNQIVGDFIKRAKERKIAVHHEFEIFNQNYKESNQESFITLIQTALEHIQQGRIKKVVIGRSKDIILKKDFDLPGVFNQLCQNYPNAFVSLVVHPYAGIWLGASPELLVQIKNNFFKTVSLAGTQAVKRGQELSEAVWTQKDIEEQALVSRYIVSKFKTIRLREYEEEGPRTVQAGTLMHLQTDYKVDMNEVSFPALGTMMLDLLHPTSAVCGMPKEEALSFIGQHENLDREFYSGFLGPVNIQNETDIFVNIRCAKILKDKARLYAGAGIIKDSKPEREWEETEMKMRTLEKFLV